MFAGAMQPQSAGITPEEGRAIARYLTGKEFRKTEASMSGMCAADAKPFRMGGTGWNGWGVETANTLYQRNPGFSAAEAPKPKLKRASGFQETSMAYAQPTISAG